MKEIGLMIKICGDLRVSCGDLKPKVPAGYSLVGECVTSFAGTCGDFSFTTYARARAHTHKRAHMRRSNRLKDSAGPRNVIQLLKRQRVDLRGPGLGSPRKDSAMSPQGPRKVTNRTMEAI